MTKLQKRSIRRKATQKKEDPFREKLREVLMFLQSLPPKEPRVFLFSDIRGSTEKMLESEELDQGKSYLRFITYHHLIMEQVVQEHGGTVHEVWGDGALSSFYGLGSALAAIFKFDEFANKKYNKDLQGGKPPEIFKLKFGIHKGPFYALPLEWQKRVLRGEKDAFKEDGPGQLMQYISAGVAYAQKMQTLTPPLSFILQYQVCVSERLIKSDDLQNQIAWHPKGAKDFGTFSLKSGGHINHFIIISYKKLTNFYPNIKKNDEPVYIIEPRDSFIARRALDAFDSGLKTKDLKNFFFREYWLRVPPQELNKILRTMRSIMT